MATIKLITPSGSVHKNVLITEDIIKVGDLVKFVDEKNLFPKEQKENDLNSPYSIEKKYMVCFIDDDNECVDYEELIEDYETLIVTCGKWITMTGESSAHSTLFMIIPEYVDELHFDVRGSVKPLIFLDADNIKKISLKNVNDGLSEKQCKKLRNLTELEIILGNNLDLSKLHLCKKLEKVTIDESYIRPDIALPPSVKELVLKNNTKVCGNAELRFTSKTKLKRLIFTTKCLRIPSVFPDEIEELHIECIVRNSTIETLPTQLRSLTIKNTTNPNATKMPSEGYEKIEQLETIKLIGQFIFTKQPVLESVTNAVFSGVNPLPIVPNCVELTIRRSDTNLFYKMPNLRKLYHHDNGTASITMAKLPPKLSILKIRAGTVCIDDFESENLVYVEILCDVPKIKYDSLPQKMDVLDITISKISNLPESIPNIESGEIIVRWSKCVKHQRVYKSVIIKKTHVTKFLETYPGTNFHDYAKIILSNHDPDFFEY